MVVVGASLLVGTFCTDLLSLPSGMVSIVVIVFTSPHMLVDVRVDTGTSPLVVVVVLLVLGMFL